MFKLIYGWASYRLPEIFLSSLGVVVLTLLIMVTTRQTKVAALRVTFLDSNNLTLNETNGIITVQFPRSSVDTFSFLKVINTK